MNGNDNKREGQADELKGRAQEAWGDLTGNDEAKAEGQENQAQGKGKQFAGDVKNAVDDITG